MWPAAHRRAAPGRQALLGSVLNCFRGMIRPSLEKLSKAIHHQDTKACPGLDPGTPSFTKSRRPVIVVAFPDHDDFLTRAWRASIIRTPAGRCWEDRVPWCFLV